MSKRAMSLAGWQRASLTMLILDVLAVAPRHGYASHKSSWRLGCNRLREFNYSQSWCDWKGQGANRRGAGECKSGPARKVYELIAAGRARGAALSDEWHSFIDAAEAIARADPVKSGWRYISSPAGATRRNRLQALLTSSPREKLGSLLAQ